LSADEKSFELADRLKAMRVPLAEGVVAMLHRLLPPPPAG